MKGYIETKFFEKTWFLTKSIIDNRLKIILFASLSAYFVKRHSIRIVFSLFIAIAMMTSGMLEAAFDDDFTGARARGMGGAFTALSDDADGLLTNPAGLSRIAGQQLTATMATLYAGLTDESSITQNLVGYAYSNPQKVSMGFVWKRLSVSNLYSENTVAVGLARQYKFGSEDKVQTLSIGTTIRLLNWSVIPIVGSDGRILEKNKGRTNVSFDAGVIFRPSENTPIAFSVQNVNRPDIASEGSSVSERIPINIRLGIAVSGEKASWAMDLAFKQTQVDVKVGFEWQLYPKIFAIRMGFRLENLAWGTNITTGASFRPNQNVRIDYAFVYPVGNVAETFGSHRVSVVYDF